MRKPPAKTKPNLEMDHEEERDDAIIGRAVRWSLVALMIGSVGFAVMAYFLNRAEIEPQAEETEFELLEQRLTPLAQPPEVHFVDITDEAGIRFQHENGAYGDKLLPETMGGGCAFLDFDADGDQDILFVNSCRWSWDQREPSRPATMALYRNDGGCQFTDVTAAVGLDVTFYGMGAAVADYDNDGDSDIFISAVGPNHLFRNDSGQFVEVSDTAGVAGEKNEWSSSCCWFDFNNDGRLDLFVCNYIRWTKELDLSQDFRLVGVGRAYGPPMAFGGTFPYLYRNEGGGRFTDVSAAAGIQITNPSTGRPMAKSMGVAPIDLDRDGWLDLVVANDTVQNFLLQNRRDGTFEEVGALAGIAFDAAGNARGGMGIDAACYRNDQTLAVAIGNYSNEMTAFYCAAESPLQFVDTAIANGLGPATRLELTFGLFFFDYDLDGRLDLLAANGHLEEEINRVQASQHYRQPPQLFWNCGPDSATEFVAVSRDRCGEEFHRELVGRGAAFADIDEDGDSDVLLMQAGGRARLLRNEQHLGHHWVRLQLIGRSCTRDAIGAWIEVHVGDAVYRRQVMPTRSYLSQCELPVTVGIGKANRVDKVVVDWPDGLKQELTEVETDCLTRVEQPEGRERS